MPPSVAPKSACPAYRARDRPLALAEERAGQFVPYNLTPMPPRKFGHCMRCWELPDACLEINAVPNATRVYNDPRSNTIGVGLYKQKRPFRIYVNGLTADELKMRLERLGSYVKDPLFSQILRHLERDIVWANRSGLKAQGIDPWAHYPRGGGNGGDGGPADGVGADDELTMVWPYWEKGYGDVIANTLLPFGELLRMGSMPRHLALAGMRHATLLPPLAATTSSLCASERASEHLAWNCVRA